MPVGDPPPDNKPERIAEEMVENLKELNEHMRNQAERQITIGGLLDDIIDWFNVVDKTMEILNENNKEARKLSLADFAKAWELAADEVFEEEDEPGDEDPLVGARGR